jgi:SAM-dependent methyltransferase
MKLDKPIPPERVRRDFDRIAHLPGEGSWDHNSHYHPFLLRQLPAQVGRALEVGCGTGQFARLLAERAEAVLGLDLSPEMIALARERSARLPNVEFLVADALSWEYPREAFDCVASIATLHHLPLGPMLERFRDTLRPGGTLLILDLQESCGGADRLLDAFAVPANLALRLLHTGHLREPAEVRAAWDEHGADERYLTLSEVREAAERVLPGARARRHPLWRYSLVWRKPTSRSEEAIGDA